MKKVGYLGFVLTMIGCGSMDSAQIAVPLIMAFFGMALMYISAAERGNNDTL